jgi:hypothetical protein
VRPARDRQDHALHGRCPQELHVGELINDGCHAAVAGAAQQAIGILVDGELGDGLAVLRLDTWTSVSFPVVELAPCGERIGGRRCRRLPLLRAVGSSARRRSLAATDGRGNDLSGAGTVGST